MSKQTRVYTGSHTKAYVQDTAQTVLHVLITTTERFDVPVANGQHGERYEDGFHDAHEDEHHGQRAQIVRVFGACEHVQANSITDRAKFVYLRALCTYSLREILCGPRVIQDDN